MWTRLLNSDMNSKYNAFCFQKIRVAWYKAWAIGEHLSTFLEQQYHVTKQRQNSSFEPAVRMFFDFEWLSLIWICLNYFYSFSFPFCRTLDVRLVMLNWWNIQTVSIGPDTSKNTKVIPKMWFVIVIGQSRVTFQLIIDCIIP